MVHAGFDSPLSTNQIQHNLNTPIMNPIRPEYTRLNIEDFQAHAWEMTNTPFKFNRQLVHHSGIASLFPMEVELFRVDERSRSKFFLWQGHTFELEKYRNEGWIWSCDKRLWGMKQYSLTDAGVDSFTIHPITNSGIHYRTRREAIEYLNTYIIDCLVSAWQDKEVTGTATPHKMWNAALEKINESDDPARKLRMIASTSGTSDAVGSQFIRAVFGESIHYCNNEGVYFHREQQIKKRICRPQVYPAPAPDQSLSLSLQVKEWTFGDERDARWVYDDEWKSY